MIDFKNLTPAEVERACREAIEACDRGIEAIVATPADERTFENSLVALESAVDHMAQAGGQYAFMAYVAADDTLRETAREWEETLDKHGVELAFREDLYQAIRGFAETPEAGALTGDAKRLLDRTLRDYRRNGFELPKEQRERVQALMNRLVELGTVFRKAIDDWDDGILVERERLAGMPDRWIDGLKTVQEDGVTKYRVSLDYPEIMPFMDNAEDEQLRHEMFIKNQNKGGADNVQVLEEAIRVRAEIASLLGYDSWAAYVVEVRMAKQREHVDGFLADLETKLHVKAGADMAALSKAKQAHTGDPHINIWDWWFYTNLLHKTEYAVDDFAVAQYLPLERVVEGLFLVTQELLGIRYQPAKNASVWHEDVQAFDIFEADGDRPFARFYMDLYPRPNKFGHAAAFTMRGGRRLPDGSYQEPASAIVANFTKPTPDTPSLLRHTEVVTFFHEFGHILHQTLTRARFLEFSGSSTERDFVEAPSQMLEHWVWDRDVLRRFARHHETGEALPDDLLDAMLRAKNLSSGIANLRQMFFARLDFAIHSPGFDGDTTRAVRELYPVTGFPYPEGTHFQGGFGHLFGYDAGYYGYLWSRVFGDDMFTRFEAAGVLDRATGLDYRRAILERGGSVDGDVLVRDFLGREPNNDAFLRELGLEG
ncbi:MAG TPA: M3 family metallopeptidase [Dehalococcoidia bacterium]|nr:M3 family metallopeptidase [Dehalococcoidia bacterium]